MTARVARRLEMDGTEVYELIFQGELAAGKGKDGLVYVRESALKDYKRRHPSARARWANGSLPLVGGGRAR
jgi:hypothetical protein